MLRVYFTSTTNNIYKLLNLKVLICKQFGFHFFFCCKSHLTVKIDLYIDLDTFNHAAWYLDLSPSWPSLILISFIHIIVLPFGFVHLHLDLNKILVLFWFFMKENVNSNLSWKKPKVFSCFLYRFCINFRKWPDVCPRYFHYFQPQNL